ncbi:Polyprenol reductase 2 [Camellia lanceoleosa]|uniref:Polyprenol reductase 2 n=1 Tax=Camellia lanceoleosa TaxID=1840588 RepID=A0ACC0IRY9_9ERIC|nr:Polyprenol reductase 2 [Camellia lanceoleosa]
MEIELVALLRAAWVAATLPILVVSIPSSLLNSFHEFLLGFAKRGKIMQSSSQKFTVPQKFFCHFYTLAVVWTTFLLAATWFYAYKMHCWCLSHCNILVVKVQTLRDTVWRSVFLLLLMEVQALRCLVKTIYVFNYSPSAWMHVFGYLPGLFFYTAALLSLCCTFALEAFVFALNRVVEFIVKGKNQIPATEFDWWGFASPLMTLRWYSWIGMGSLRKKPEQANEYVIPHGDWFDYVSSPHYLAGLVIYAGLMVASGGADLAVWLIFGFVSANLVLAGAETHKWYLHKFDNYPRSRFAIVPFVFTDFSTETGYTPG